MSAGGESLSKHLYDAAKGDVKTASILLDGAAWETVITPASGKKICILCMVIMPSGVDTDTYLSFHDGSGETTVILSGFNMAYNYPITMNFEGCPIIGAANETLKGYCETSNPTTVYVNYVEIG